MPKGNDLIFRYNLTPPKTRINAIAIKWARYALTWIISARAKKKEKIRKMSIRLIIKAKLL